MKKFVPNRCVCALLFCCALLFAADVRAAFASCTPYPSGLVSLWKAEGNADDSVGSDYGLVSGGTHFSAGKFGQAFRDPYVEMYPSPSLDVGAGNGLTVELWVKPDDLNDRPFVEWNNGTAYGAHLWQYGGPGRLFANLKDTSGVEHHIQSADNVLVARVWQHVALTYDKSSGVARLYRNGVSVAVQNLGNFSPQTSYKLWLGHRPTDGSIFFSGGLDEVSLYNRALTAAEIGAIANASSSGVCAGAPSSFKFSASTYRELEDRSATITVERSGDSGAVSVNYTASNGTAAVGSDYSTTSGTLMWADGDESPKTFTVPLLNDAATEADETVNLRLSNLTGGATLGSPAAAVLTILDDESRVVVVTNTTDSSPGSLRQAIARAVVDAPIVFNIPTTDPGYEAASGRWTINLTSGELLINKNLYINDPGAAKVTVRRSAVAGTPEFRIFRVMSGVTATISGLMISGGKTDYGGGISNGGTLTVSNSTFAGNTAIGNGGGIYNDEYANLTVRDSIFSGNTSSVGGGVANAGTLNVMGCTFSSNSATSGSGNTFSAGGGIANFFHTTVSVSGSTFSGNSAVNGGGIYNTGHWTTVSGSTFSGNTASSGGGLYDSCGDGDQTTVSGSTFSRNTASSRGGGIYVDSTYADSTLTVTGSTITGNTAPAGAGSGIYSLANDPVLRTTVQSSIIAGNTRSDVDFPDNIYYTNNFRSGGYNLIGSGNALSAFNQAGDQTVVATAQLKFDPAGLNYNGGPTKTIALLAGSVAIDGGKRGASTDQRGAVRVDDPDVVNASGSDGSDVGAFEFGSAPPDTTPPTIAIATPANNAIINALPAISGTAADNATGVVRVDLYLQRKSDNLYWNGTQWAAPVSVLVTTLSGAAPRQWTRNTGLPSGASLANGAYLTTARAFDAAGNGTLATANFIVDTIAPAITIATPVNNATVASLPAISGTASDNTGVVRVDLYLQRKSDNLYWNGSAWVAPVTVLSTTLSGAAPRQWTRNFALPSGASLANGAYLATARAFDAAGNGTTVSSSFYIDTVAPTIAIATPANNAIINALPAISGTAADNATGVVRVDLYLQRKSDNLYWNGTSWAAPATALSTALSGAAPRQWTRNFGLPSGASLANSTYFTAARAFDAAGNGTSATANFIVDTIAPAIVIASPANNATVALLPSISGTASDNTGVIRVDLYLQRKSDNLYWNGSAWVAPVTVLTTTLSGAAPRQWTRNTGLPSGTSLANGAYLATARAIDTAGNGTSATSNFTVNRPTAASSPSPVQLSSASAKSDGTIKLTFTGALNESASEAANYSVSQNEQAVAVANVSQPDASTVEIACTHLTAGTRVSVAYNIQDSQGREVKGTTNVVVK